MEVKYMLPPSGPIFHVHDHVGWAIKNMFPEYTGKGDGWEEWDIIYDMLRNKGYHTLVWMPATDELYSRTPIRQLSPSHKRKIGDLADKLADQGYSYKVELIDDEGDSEILWKQPDMNMTELLKESVTVSVGGAHHEYPELKTLMDLSFAFARTAVWPVIEKKFSSEEKETFQKIGLAADVLTPDGFDFDKPTGVLNFYISGISPHHVKTMLSGIKDEADNLGIDLGPQKVEKSGMYNSQVIRIPVVKNPWSKAEQVPELQMANRNFVVFFRDVLNLIEDDEWGFSLPVETVEKALQPLLRGTDTDQMKKLEPHTIQPGQREVEPRLPGDEWKPESPDDAVLRALGGKGYDMGLSMNQLSRYAQALNDVVQWAKKKGFKTISAG